jgi:hypothetical protein
MRPPLGGLLKQRLTFVICAGRHGMAMCTCLTCKATGLTCVSPLPMLSMHCCTRQARWPLQGKLTPLCAMHRPGCLQHGCQYLACIRHVLSAQHACVSAQDCPEQRQQCVVACAVQVPVTGVSHVKEQCDKSIYSTSITQVSLMSRSSAITARAVQVSVTLTARRSSSKYSSKHGLDMQCHGCLPC